LTDTNKNYNAYFFPKEIIMKRDLELTDPDLIAVNTLTYNEDFGIPENYAKTLAQEIPYTRVLTAFEEISLVRGPNFAKELLGENPDLCRLEGSDLDRYTGNLRKVCYSGNTNIAEISHPEKLYKITDTKQESEQPKIAKKLAKQKSLANRIIDKGLAHGGKLFRGGRKISYTNLRINVTRRAKMSEKDFDIGYKYLRSKKVLDEGTGVSLTTKLDNITDDEIKRSLVTLYE
jgi:hypothetical protein